MHLVGFTIESKVVSNLTGCVFVDYQILNSFLITHFSFFRFYRHFFLACAPNLADSAARKESAHFFLVTSTFIV